MRKSEWRKYFNKLSLICGAVALMAVASGARVEPLSSIEVITQSPPEIPNRPSDQTGDQPGIENLTQPLINIEKKNAPWKFKDPPKKETCPWTICRNLGMRR